MATHSLLKDSSKTWEINASNDTWILGKNATLSVVNAPAIFVDQQYEGNTISILGDILNTGAYSYGVMVMGSGNDINIGADSEIDALTGISTYGSDTQVNNKGHINGMLLGTALMDDSGLINSGKIDGLLGAVFNENGTVTNRATGKILGGEDGVFFYDGENSLRNFGLISGGDFAVNDGDGTSRIANRGRLDGDVLLLGGDDVFDNRNGTFNGIVYGGDGNDAYVINAYIKIVEDPNSGSDRVLSSVGHTLQENVERLILRGDADINGRGNDDNNSLRGNDGDNRLWGLEGSDRLKGEAGNDTMTGGGGEDRFIFRAGFATDTIADFADGQDKIAVLGFADVQNLAQLQPLISQQGTDIWISFANGDRIVIEDRLANILTVDDFIFAL